MYVTIFRFLVVSFMLCLSPASLLLANGTDPEDHSQPPLKIQKPQTVCPVMGGPIDKGLYVDVKGKRVYLCCAACEDAVRAEPDKYLKKIKGRGETVDDTPTAQ